MVEQSTFKFFFLFALLCCVTCFSQPFYEFQISTTPELCGKGAAALTISGTEASDTVNITWSTGPTQVTVLNLDQGNYSVSIHINSSVDTTLYFTVDKEECPVYVSRQFTPNGDGYNDLLQISHTENYPNFELEIYNKWGQRVHAQKQSYTPWDGKWLGAHVPDGTYYFVFFYDAGNKNKLMKGDITILR